MQHRCHDIYTCVSIADQTVTLSLDSSVDGIFTILPDTDKIIVLDGSKLDRYVVKNNTLEPLYCGHHWDPSNCPDFRGVLNSEVFFVQNCHNCDKSKCPYLRGVLISGVSTLRFPLYNNDNN